MSKPNYYAETLRAIAALIEALEAGDEKALKAGGIQFAADPITVQLDNDEFGRLVYEDGWAWEPPTCD